jgi:hypothetical protein
MTAPAHHQFTHGGHAPRNRYTKAYTLARLMEERCSDPAAADWLCDPAPACTPDREVQRQKVRRLAERTAGVRHCSELTWKWAGALLRDLRAGVRVLDPEHAQFCTEGHYLDADTGMCECEDGPEYPA